MMSEVHDAFTSLAAHRTTTHQHAAFWCLSVCIAAGGHMQVDDV
jgi:hypothetical protein